MAKKRLAAIVKIQIPAGQATPAPPVGTALGPHGINIMDFCKAYNAATESQRGMVIPAEISIFEDRSFTFVTKTPPTPFLLRQAAGIEKGAANPRTDKAGRSPRRRCARSPRRRCPTSTPSTSKAPSPRLPAPPARWASTSPARPHPLDRRRQKVTSERRYSTPKLRTQEGASGGPRRRHRHHAKGADRSGGAQP